MNSARVSVVVRIAAAVASIATSMALLSAVVSLSEPQRGQLMAATAIRQRTTQQHVLLVAQAKRAQTTPVAEVTAR